MERLAERDLGAARAVPTELEHGRLECGELERGGEAGGGAARVHDEVRVARRVRRRLERDAETLRRRGLARVDVDELDVAAAARGEPRDEAADGARADHRDAVAEPRRRVPDSVDRRLEVRGEHRARGWHAVRQRVHGRDRHDVARLVRIEAKHRAAA